jgi:hypothetical protein
MLEKIEKDKDELNLSKSKLINKALDFYFNYKSILKNIEPKKLSTYVEMLKDGEHLILDIDHFILFLMSIEEDSEEFWNEHKEIARSHAEQLSKISSVKSLLERLEACNFFKIGMESDTCFTLLLGTEVSKKFIRVFLEEYCKKIGYDIEIKEGISKFRLQTKPLKKGEQHLTAF